MDRQICKRCNVDKPITEFYTNPSWASGYHSSCKVCIDTRQRELKNRRAGGIHTTLSPEELGEQFFEIQEVKEIFTRLGYNVEEDIHQQFVEKMRIKYGVSL